MFHLIVMEFGFLAACFWAVSVLALVFRIVKFWISIDFGISVELDESGVDVFVC